jgi:hypothetical protein
MKVGTGLATRYSRITLNVYPADMDVIAKDRNNQIDEYETVGKINTLVLHVKKVVQVSNSGHYMW